MAASSFTSQIGDEFKEQFLTCQICFEPYDSTECVAKCLPCLHTFCLSCLKEHAGKRPKFNCPKCRGTVTLPDGSVDCLPNNFLVENLTEYQDFINHAVLCGDCDDANKAVSFCHDCRLFLCQPCVDIHLKRRSIRHHKLATMQELQQQNYRPQNEQVCQKHPAQALALYCKDNDCKVPVCALCGLVDHRGHELVDVTEAVNEVTAEIKEYLTKATYKAQEFGKKKALIEADRKKLCDSAQQNIQEIRALELKFIDMMKSRCREATLNVDQLCKSESEKLTNVIDSLDSMINQTTDACKFANEVCNINHPIQLLTSQHQIKTRLRELENAEVVAAFEKKELSFTDDHHLAVTRLQKSLKSLFVVGSIRSNETSAAKSQIEIKTKSINPNKLVICNQESGVLIQKQQIDPEQCTVEFIYEARDLWKATIRTVDTTGQVMKTGGAKVIVVAKYRNEKLNMVINVHDNNNGTYSTNSFRWRSWLRLHITINGKHIHGSPFDESSLF